MCTWAAGVVILQKGWAKQWFLVFMITSLMIGPMVWSGMTTFNQQPDVDLPIAGPLTRKGLDGAVLTENQQLLLDYLNVDYKEGTFLFAVMDSHGASPFILASGKPVFTFGGYIGADNVIDTNGLAALVESGKLRYVMDNNNLSSKPEIAGWVTDHCSAVEVPGVVSRSIVSNGGPREQVFKALYDCGAE